jgi:hypothetical protein
VSAVGKGVVVGLSPWLPWPMSRWRWWTEPIRAERLAALRVGLAAVLLLDVFATYLPNLRDLYCPDALGGPEQFPWLWAPERWSWSLLRNVEDPRLLLAAALLWAAAVLGLLVGWRTRFCAALAWVLAVSFGNLNPIAENSGDRVRNIILFYLMLCSCGAVWSLDGRRRERRRSADRVTDGRSVLLVSPWPARLLFVQLVFIYFCNGMHKIVGSDWLAGRSLYCVMGDLTLTRWSCAEFALPYRLTQLLTWLVLGWEVLFPLLVCWRPLRIAALSLGVAFHLGIWISLELGLFAPYVLCLYLPLVPWETWADRGCPSGEGNV